MKKIMCGLSLLFIVLFAVSALDSKRIQFWEGELSMVMSSHDKSQLELIEKKWAAEITKNPQDFGLKVKLGILYHNLSRVMMPLGVKGHAAKSAELLETVVKSSAEEELKVFALPYLGSSIALQGKEDSSPISKVTFVNKAMEFLNEGVSKYSSVSYLPEFLRAKVALALPDFFKKLDIAGQDLKSLVDKIAKSPTSIPVMIQSDIHNSLGNFYKKNSNVKSAIEEWKIAVSLDPDKKGPGKEAAKSLETYLD